MDQISHVTLLPCEGVVSITSLDSLVFFRIIHPMWQLQSPTPFILYISGECDLPLSPSAQWIVYADGAFFQPINSSNLSSFQVAHKGDGSHFLHVMQRSHSRCNWGDHECEYEYRMPECYYRMCVWESSRNPQAPECNDNASSVKLKQQVSILPLGATH